eukprot:3338864-Rhodomonas_salina.1
MPSHPLTFPDMHEHARTCAHTTPPEIGQHDVKRARRGRARGRAVGEHAASAGREDGGVLPGAG